MAIELVGTTEVDSGGATSIEFTAIPDTGKDLLLVFSCRTDVATLHTSTYLTLNSDTGNNYSWHFVRSDTDGTNASHVSLATDDSAWVAYTPGTSSATSIFGNAQVLIGNYTSSEEKTISLDSGNVDSVSAVREAFGCSTWSGTNAISSLQLFPSSGNFVQYSSASLYIIS